MTITLTPDMELIVRQKVDSGQFPSPTDVVRESLRLLSAQDQFHTLKADIASGMEQSDGGNMRFFDMDGVLRGVRDILHAK